MAKRVQITLLDDLFEKLKQMAQDMDLELEEFIRALLVEAMQRKEKQLNEWFAQRRQ